MQFKRRHCCLNAIIVFVKMNILQARIMNYKDSNIMISSQSWLPFQLLLDSTWDRTLVEFMVS